MEIVDEYRKLFTNVVCEPDKGIADAMNKGLQYCTGEFVLFLHSDDYLSSAESIAKAITFLDDQHGIFAFDILFDRDGNQERRRPDAFSRRINFKTTFYHQAVLCRKSLFDELGNFDRQFEIAMDYDFFLRAYHKNIQVKRCNEVISVVRDTGISSRNDWGTLQRRFNDERLVHEKNCRSWNMKMVYQVYWLLYPNYRKLRHRMR